MDVIDIKDGTGTLNNVRNTVDNAMPVTAGSRLHAATLAGRAYSWNAVSADIDTTDCMILISNQSQRELLVISHCYIWGDEDGQLDFKLCDTHTLTLAGTAITGVNLNRAMSAGPPALAFGDETASPATTIFYTHFCHEMTVGETTTCPMEKIDFHDSIILGWNNAFGIDTILEPAAGYEATVIGYYIDK